jgi:hypothetical protein
MSYSGNLDYVNTVLNVELVEYRSFCTPSHFIRLYEGINQTYCNKACFLYYYLLCKNYNWNCIRIQRIFAVVVIWRGKHATATLHEWGIYVTTLARLKILGATKERAICCNTDSVIYIQKCGQHLVVICGDKWVIRQMSYVPYIYAWSVCVRRISRTELWIPEL